MKASLPLKPLDEQNTYSRRRRLYRLIHGQDARPAGCSVTTLDDLSPGHRDAVLCGDFVQGDMADRSVLDAVLSRGFDAVMHFASFIQVGESVQQPAKYYQNNVVNTLGLSDAMLAHSRRI